MTFLQNRKENPLSLVLLKLSRKEFPVKKNVISLYWNPYLV